MDMGGAPPHTDNLIRSAAGGRRPNRTVEKMTRERRALSSRPSCNSRALLNSARSNARKADLEAGPLDSHNQTNHRRGSKAVPKPQRSHESNGCGGELSRWRHATAKQAISSLHTRTTEGARAEHVTPETKNWTHAGKRNNQSLL